MNEPTTAVDVDRFPMLGRLHLCARGNPVTTLFGRLFTDSADNQTLVDLAPPSSGYRDRCSVPPGRGTVAISTTHRSALRNTAVAVAPMTYNELASAPANQRLESMVAVKLEIDAELDSGRRQFLIDVGQTLELQASTVSVALASTDGTVQVTFNGESIDGRPIVPIAGSVFDTAIGIALARVESPIGATSAVLTTLHRIPQNTAAVITVPAFAVGVEISQTLAGAAAGAWPLFFGHPNFGGLAIGSLPFVLNARVSIPGASMQGATHIQTDVDAAAARFAICRWIVQP